MYYEQRRVEDFFWRGGAFWESLQGPSVPQPGSLLWQVPTQWVYSSLFLFLFPESIWLFISSVLRFRLGSEFTPQKQLKQEAETIMHQLMTFVHFTAVRILVKIGPAWLSGWQFHSFFKIKKKKNLLCFQDLYHELHALDRFEQDYQRKIQEEENPSTVQRGITFSMIFRFVGYPSDFCSICVEGVGDTLAILRTELKSQKKHVRNLQKKSLWSRILEEVRAANWRNQLYVLFEKFLGSSNNY